MTERHSGVWPSLSPAAWFASTGVVGFPLSAQHCEVYSLGRHALFNGVKAIGLKPGDAVLVPAFHHGSEIEALIQAGLRCIFYPTDELLRPRPDSLADLLSDDVKAFYLIHYLGFPQDSDFWRSWSDDHGILFIEDAAQAFLAESRGRLIGELSDLAIYCIYKTFGLADGAAVIAKNPLPKSSAASGTGLPKLAKRHVAWLAQRSGFVAATHRRLAAFGPPPGQTHDHEKEFFIGDTRSKPSATTRMLLHRVVDEGAMDVRRANFVTLADALERWIPLPFKELPEGASPFAFPIVSRDPDETVGYLRSHGIHAIRYWTFPHPTLPESDFPIAKKLRGSTVILPVHQELTDRNLRLIVDRVLAVETN